MDFSKNLKFWFPVIVYSGIIYLGSSIPGKIAPSPIPFLDKILHMLEYAPFGFLIGRALFYARPRRMGAKIFMAAITFLCLLYGLMDEYHQSFVLGRDSSLWDALADTVGGFLGGLVFIFRKGYGNVNYQTF